MVVDVHSHFLPGIDDGAKNVETAKKLLKISYKSGVDAVIATPHYYSDISVDRFLEKRKNALESIGQLDEGYPEIFLWAEVYYNPHLKNMDLEPLTLNGKLLLELPFEAVSENTIKDIEYIKHSRGIDIVIAHVERYSRIEPLFDLDVEIQVNAGSVRDFKVRRLIKQGKVDYLGSDMHSIDQRPPNLIDGYGFLYKRVPDKVEKMCKNGEKLIDV